MDFKIGDKISIWDGSYSVFLKTGIYNKQGVHGNNKITGRIIATDCRLPIGLNSWGERPTPCEGMPSSCYGTLFNDLLVETDKGFVFTSSDLVRPVLPEYKLVLYGVKMDITETQFNDLVEVGFFKRFGPGEAYITI